MAVARRVALVALAGALFALGMVPGFVAPGLSAPTLLVALLFAAAAISGLQPRADPPRDTCHRCQATGVALRICEECRRLVCRRHAASWPGNPVATRLGIATCRECRDRRPLPPR